MEAKKSAFFTKVKGQSRYSQRVQKPSRFIVCNGYVCLLFFNIQFSISIESQIRTLNRNSDKVNWVREFTNPYHKSLSHTTCRSKPLICLQANIPVERWNYIRSLLVNTISHVRYFISFAYLSVINVTFRIICRFIRPFMHIFPPIHQHTSSVLSYLLHECGVISNSSFSPYRCMLGVTPGTA